MSESDEVQQNKNFDATTIIENLEKECYLNREFNSAFKDDVRLRIEEFTHWFNSTGRLYLLRCDPDECENYVYLLLNLKKKLKYAISEINKSVSSYEKSFTCNVCEEKIDIQPWQNIWTKLQEHSHFEEQFSSICEKGQSETLLQSIIENGESSTSNDSTVDDLSEDLNQIALAETAPRIKPENIPDKEGVNDFKFNFVVSYDERVEEALYPEPLVVTARKRDFVTEYTVQRCGVSRGVCLLCPCSLISKGRVFKITPFVIKNHVNGQKHLRFASMKNNKSALRQYHEFWRSQEPAYQAHQVHFVPEVYNVRECKCHLCQEIMQYSKVIDHIKDKTHKNRVIKIFNSPEAKLNELYLLDMQVEVYDIIVNHSSPKKEDKLKEIKNETNSTKLPKCVFVKFVVEPDIINLPPRYKDHLDFFTQTGDSVFCKICKTNFINNVNDVKMHIIHSQQHKQTSGIPSPKHTYFCEICNITLKDEYTWDEHFTKGPNRHDSMAEERKLNVCECECKTCKVVLYGDELSMSRHISARTAKGRVKEVKLPYSVKKLFKSKLFIEEEANHIKCEANQVLEYQEKMKECCEDLEGALSGIYPNCKAYPFGSRASGLGNNQSDLDIFMDIGEMYVGDRLQDSQSQEQIVKKASKQLRLFKEDFSFVVPIPSARTPIIKLHHNYTDLDCDISFRHGLGVENTKFLKFCIDLQPILQPFILLLKRWSDYCKLNEHITNYGLALMAIFYLQTCGYLPSVKTVRSHNPSQSLVIDGWDTLNYTVPLEKMKEYVKICTLDVKQLLRDFFYYFSKFDYANAVVCPLLGNVIPKWLFNENPEENLPIEMKSYVQRIQSDNGEQFRGLTPFCIQDPFDLSHNLTKACQHGTINKLRSLCTLTYEFLDSIE